MQQNQNQKKTLVTFGLLFLVAGVLLVTLGNRLVARGTIARDEMRQEYIAEIEKQVSAEESDPGDRPMGSTIRELLRSKPGVSLLADLSNRNPRFLFDEANKVVYFTQRIKHSKCEFGVVAESPEFATVIASSGLVSGLMIESLQIEDDKLIIEIDVLETAGQHMINQYHLQLGRRYRTDVDLNQIRQRGSPLVTFQDFSDTTRYELVEK